MLSSCRLPSLLINRFFLNLRSTFLVNDSEIHDAAHPGQIDTKLVVLGNMGAPLSHTLMADSEDPMDPNTNPRVGFSSDPLSAGL